MKTIIRPMLAADLSAVTEIDRLCFSQPWSQNAYQSELTNQRARCWVAQVDEQLAGVLVLWQVLDEAQIATIGVHPAFRRQGIGSLLLKTALQTGYGEGMRTYTLEVRAGNAAAQKLYGEFGFEVVGRRPRYYRDNGEDAVLMTKVVR